MGRAITAWLILNAITLFTLGIATWVLYDFMSNWFVAGPMLIALILAEIVIATETVSPIVKEWINQYVDADETKNAER